MLGPGATGSARKIIADEQAAQLLNLNDPGEVQEDIMCGGQLTSIPRRFLVDFQTALTAAVHHLATTQAAPALDWEWS